LPCPADVEFALSTAAAAAFAGVVAAAGGGGGGSGLQSEGAAVLLPLATTARSLILDVQQQLQASTMKR
jgi:hypothetical protein